MQILVNLHPQVYFLFMHLSRHLSVSIALANIFLHPQVLAAMHINCNCIFVCQVINFIPINYCLCFCKTCLVHFTLKCSESKAY